MRTVGNIEQFLLQQNQLDPGDFISSADRDGIKTASVPFTFTISHTALSKASDIPQQCLQLPPTMTVGTVLQDENSGQNYAQPRVSYSLVADIELRSASDHQTTVSGNKEIPVWAFSAPNPPVNTHDFPAEFVETLYHPCRPNRLRKETFLVTMSTSEPPAITLTDRRLPGSTSCNIYITVTDTRLGSDGRRLLDVSQNIRLNFTPALRVKTFYSMYPFSKMPGQTMLSMRGPLRLHDELRTLPSNSYSNLRWQSKVIETHGQQAETLPAGAEVVAAVSIMIQVRAGLPPSFCSAVVSRQYSLILHCKFKGVHVDSFGLEVPLQVVYEPSKCYQGPQSIMPGSSPIADSGERTHSLQPVIHMGDEMAANLHSVRQQESRPSPPDYDTLTSVSQEHRQGRSTTRYSEIFTQSI